MIEVLLKCALCEIMGRYHTQADLHKIISRAIFADGWCELGGSGSRIRLECQRYRP